MVWPGEQAGVWHALCPHTHAPFEQVQVLQGLERLVAPSGEHASPELTNPPLPALAPLPAPPLAEVFPALPVGAPRSACPAQPRSSARAPYEANQRRTGVDMTLPRIAKAVP